MNSPKPVYFTQCRAKQRGDYALKENNFNGQTQPSQYLTIPTIIKNPPHGGSIFHLKLLPPNGIARSLPQENQSKGKGVNMLRDMVENEIKIAIEEGLGREKTPLLAHISSWNAMGEHYCPGLMAVKKLLEKPSSGKTTLRL